MGKGDSNGRATTITINADAESGDITVGPTAAHLAPGRKVTFSAGAAVRSFLLVFYEGTPFQARDPGRGEECEGRVEVRGTRRENRGQVDVFVSKEAPPGVYHYQVIALVDDDRLVADTGCPTVIIQKK
jgi:hypothetical protein